MAKEVAGLIKLQIKGGAANPSPPVGPALGSKGTMQTSLLASLSRLPLQLFSCWRPLRSRAVLPSLTVRRWLA